MYICTLCVCIYICVCVQSLGLLLRSMARWQKALYTHKRIKKLSGSRSTIWSLQAPVLSYLGEAQHLRRTPETAPIWTRRYSQKPPSLGAILVKHILESVKEPWNWKLCATTPHEMQVNRYVGRALSKCSQMGEGTEQGTKTQTSPPRAELYI